MHITEEHLRHMARRHHATMQKLDAINGRVAGSVGRFIGTIESVGGAFLGGVIEGRWGGPALGPLPVNLLAGIGALVLSHAKTRHIGKYSDDLHHVGNGLVNSWLSAVGFAFGKRVQSMGLRGALGSGATEPFMHPYAP